MEEITTAPEEEPTTQALTDSPEEETTTTTTAELTQIDATALNRFTNTAYLFMSLIFVIIVCKALYKLFNIFF